MLKLITTDVDGTLLKDGTMTLNPKYMKVIRELTEKGIAFVVCSGRQYDSERKLFEEVKDLVYFVSDGGTVIRKNDKILKTHTLSEETCAFGDNLNDIAMLEKAGMSYAVANAREEVKTAAKKICPSYSEDGVLQILTESIYSL